MAMEPVVQAVSDEPSASETLLQREIASRRCAEEERDRFFALSPDLYCIIGADGFLLRVNAALASALGYTLDAMSRTAFDRYLHPDDLESTRQEIDRVLCGGITRNFQVRLVHRNGEFLWTDWTAVGDGQVLFASGRDVTEKRRMEQNLLENERWLRILFEKSPLGVALVHAATGRFVRVNRRYAELVGYSREEMVNTSARELTHPDDLSMDLAALEGLLSGGVPEYTLRKRCIRKDGTVIWVNLTVSAAWQPGEPPEHYIAIVEETTARLQAEEAVNKQKIFIEAVLENIQDGVVACNEQGMLSFFNQASRDFHGKREQNLPPEQWSRHYDLYRPDGVTLLPIEEIPLYRAFSGQSVLEQELVVAPENGTRRTLLATGRAICDAAGNKLGAVVSMHDITMQKRTEDALRLSESRFRGAFETAAHGMVLASPEGRFLKVNPAFCAIIGYDEEALLAIDFQSITHPDDLEADLAFVRQLLAGNLDTFQMEKRYIHRDGHLVWVVLSVSMVRDFQDQPVHFVAHILDISDRKRAETGFLTANRQLEMQVACINRIQSLFIGESHPDALFDTLLMEVLRLTDSRYGFVAEAKINAQGHVYLQTLAISNIAWDDASRAYYEAHAPTGFHFTRMHGLYAAPYLSGMPVIANDPAHDPRSCGLPEGHPPLQAFLGVPIKRQEEIVGVLGVANRPAGYDEGVVSFLEPVVTTCAQMIEGYRNRLAKRETEALLRNNERKLRESFLYARSLIEASLDPLVTISADGKIMDVNRATEEVTQKKREELIGTDFSDCFTDPEQARAGYQRVWQQGTVRDYPLALKPQGGGQPVDVLYNAALYRNEQGEAQGIFAAARDITQRKQAEIAMQQAKAQAEKAAQVKGEFLAAMSHEIRTPMNVVLGMSEMLLETDLNATQRRFAQIMHHSGRALMGVINDVLDFSRIEAGRVTLVEMPFSPRQVLEETARLMQIAAEEKGLILEAMVSADIPEAILGDDGRLRQVLINLLGNAIKFTHEGRVDVRLTCHEEKSDSLMFQVIDTGIGIAEEKISHIFEQFTQADAGINRRYGGTGLGLSISRRLVALMGGNIGVESRVGRGSRFFFDLPIRLAAASSLRVAPLERATTGQTRGLRILLAEDVEENRILFEAYLMPTPHSVVLVNDGVEAVTWVQKERFDVVIMDVQMPNMDGYTATRIIRQWEREMNRPPVPIVALSAHAMEGERARSREAGCTLYLSKPIKKQALLETLRQIADQDWPRS
ncbi:MAG: PAS domain S-box protein [Magnetococcales bacterium]|nr:PAS domain S-box protein [Magnetococcales bacterium]